MSSDFEVGTRVTFDLSHVVAFCGQRGQKPDGNWTAMHLYFGADSRQARRLSGSIAVVIKTDQRNDVLGSGLSVAEPFGQLLAIRLDKPVKSWPGGPGDFKYAAIHPDALASLWQRVKARVRGRRLRRERYS